MGDAGGGLGFLDVWRIACRSGGSDFRLSGGFLVSGAYGCFWLFTLVILGVCGFLLGSVCGLMWCKVLVDCFGLAWGICGWRIYFSGLCISWCALGFVVFASSGVWVWGW